MTGDRSNRTMPRTPRPNPIRIAWNVFRAQRVAPPRPAGQGGTEDDDLARVLAELKSGGVAVLDDLRPPIERYRKSLEQIDPDELSKDGALAFWINLYNAGALELAADARAAGADSVLRVPGAFTRPFATIAGAEISLAQVEHGKIRRFKDPRIHAALVCGSVSCPTLRYEPFDHRRVDEQLEDQTRHFFASGGATLDRSRNTLHLSRILLWYAADFARPASMPAWIPPSRQRLVRSIMPWLDAEIADYLAENRPRVTFRSYSWELACTVS